MLCGPVAGAGLDTIHSRLLGRDVPIATHVPLPAVVAR
jgi:hypothetical protein